MTNKQSDEHAFLLQTVRCNYFKHFLIIYNNFWTNCFWKYKQNKSKHNVTHQTL